MKLTFTSESMRAWASCHPCEALISTEIDSDKDLCHVDILSAAAAHNTESLSFLSALSSCLLSHLHLVYVLLTHVLVFEFFFQVSTHQILFFFLL